MRFAARLSAVVLVCVGVGVVGAPVAGAADTQPPTAPSNLRVLAVTPSTVTVSFTGSRDNVGLKWYQVRVEGLRTQFTTSPSSTMVGGLKSDTTYSLTVIAIDRANNESAPSGAVTVKTPKWTPPGNLRVTSVAGGTVSLAWDATSNMPDPYRYLVFDGGRGEAVNRGWPLSITMQRLAPGTHVFTVKAMHSSGDQSQPSNPVTVIVPPRGADTTAPTAPQNVRWTVDEDDYDFTTRWDASTDDLDPAPAYELLQGFGGEWFVARYSVIGTVYEGVFVSAVRAVDNAGNRSPATPSVEVW